MMMMPSLRWSFSDTRAIPKVNPAKTLKSPTIIPIQNHLCHNPNRLFEEIWSFIYMKYSTRTLGYSARSYQQTAN